MQSVEMDVEQTISDSENELAACGNMTHSMELVQPLVEQAVEAIKSLNDTVDQMISSGSACTRYSKNPNQELKCLNSITSKYSKQWNSVTSLVQEAYYKVSGLDLLLNAETSGCKTAE
ncbi:hypothetical protein, partial [Pseudophaeobacter profundi]|uniref:hypothetical protein n=1 Tax=Pseudophaeobacter profundi TaxID=3034152 RepID=UPI00243143D9